MIKRKISSSEDLLNFDAPETPDLMSRYFVKNIDGHPIDAFLLDKSFYKPRDIMWRLTIAQKQFQNETMFTYEVLKQTEIEYSSKLWDEIKYELSAVYSRQEIEAVELVISGGPVGFLMDEMFERFERASRHSIAVRTLISRRSIAELLRDLYRLGAIGNTFRVGSTGTNVRNRWSFRGDPNLLTDKRMTIHPALVKRLSVVAPRRRGT
jgi:hypothetical protein